ncbi:MAG: hypothetical protein WEA82_00950 [Idiomarina sp.]
MRIVLMLGLVFIPVAEALAFNSDSIIACYDCSAYEKESRALSQAFESGYPQSKINVVDLANSSVITFHYEEGFGNYLAPGSYTFTQVPTTTQLRQATNSAATYASSHGLTWPSGRSGINNAADFVNHAQKNLIIDEWMHDESPLTWYGSNLLSYFGGLRFDILSGIRIRVKFEDGSEIYIKSFDWDSSNKLTMSYVEGSALDADRNEIPSDIDGYIRTFSLTEAHVESWIGNAERYGINIERQYTRSGQPSRSLMTTCTWIADDTVECRIVPSTEDSFNPQ